MAVMDADGSSPEERGRWWCWSLSLLPHSLARRDGGNAGRASTGAGDIGYRSRETEASALAWPNVLRMWQEASQSCAGVGQMAALCRGGPRGERPGWSWLLTPPLQSWTWHN